MPSALSNVILYMCRAPELRGRCCCEGHMPHVHTLGLISWRYVRCETSPAYHRPSGVSCNSKLVSYFQIFGNRWVILSIPREKSFIFPHCFPRETLWFLFEFLQNREHWRCWLMVACGRLCTTCCSLRTQLCFCGCDRAVTDSCPAKRHCVN